jgi:MFS family permease
LKNLSAILLLCIANSISGIAQGISMIAIPWYFALQSEMGKFGLIFILTNIIAIFWVPYSGTFVDKYNRKNIFLFVTTVSGLLLFSIAAFGYQNDSLPWFLVAFVFMFTFFNYNIHYPNLYAFVQEITEVKFYGRITSFIEIQGQLSSVLAGAGAALLLEGVQGGHLNVFGVLVKVSFDLEAWTIYEIFMMDALTYLLAFIFIFFIKYQSLVEKKLEDSPIRQRLMVGFRYLKENKATLTFGVASHAVFVAVLITTFYLAAIYVNNHLQASGDVFATAEIYYAVGAVFAGVAIRRIFSSTSIPLSIIIMAAFATGLFVVLGFSNNIPVFYFMFLILGLSNAGIRIQRVTYLFNHIPNHVYGRATSIFTLINIFFRILLLSLFSLPFFYQENHVVFSFFIISVFLFVSNLVLIKHYKSFIRLD